MTTERIKRLTDRLQADKIYPPIPTVLTHAEADFLTDIARDKTVLEIGSGRGFGTVFLARTALHVHSVDWHLGDRSMVDGAIAINPLGGSLGTMFMHLEINHLLPKVTAHIGRTRDVLPSWHDGWFDLAVVDGESFPQERHWDLMQAYRLVKHEERAQIVTSIRTPGEVKACQVFCEHDPGIPAGWQVVDTAGNLVLLGRPGGW